MSRSVDVVKTDFTCKHFGEKLWFDGIGCYCVNKDFIVFDKYVLIKKGRYAVGGITSG